MALSKPSDAPFYRDPTTTEAFRALSGREPLAFANGHAKAVVIGGGTGAPVTIQTLITLGFETDAIVAMADDGGSTGIIRQATDATPPGDVRKCLAAFAESADDPMTLAFQTRFGFADGHALGNLLLSSLEDITGSFPQAIRLCEELLHTKGHVLPSTLAHVNLHAKTVTGRVLEGQSVASKSSEPLRRVWLTSDAPIEANPNALDVIRNADLIALGPGSLFTSIIPNLCVPGIVDAIAESNAAVVFVSPIADMQGETKDMAVVDMVEALFSHGLDGKMDYVIANVTGEMQDGFETMNPAVATALWQQSGTSLIRYVELSPSDIPNLRARGIDVIATCLLSATSPTWHNPNALADAFQEIAKRCRLLRM